MKIITDFDVVRKFEKIHQSAKDRNIYCDISLKRVRQLLRTQNCYFTGEKIVNLSFDRIDNNKGYTDSNVVCCEQRFNERKNSLTIFEIEKMYKALVKHGDIKVK